MFTLKQDKLTEILMVIQNQNLARANVLIFSDIKFPFKSASTHICLFIWCQINFKDDNNYCPGMLKKLPYVNDIVLYSIYIAMKCLCQHNNSK